MAITEQEIEALIERVKACEEEIGKGIIGQKDIIRQVLIGILSGGNVLLEGVPGLGKTQLVKTIAKVLDLSFSRIQFTPDLMPADVVGTNLIIRENDKNVFQFDKGPVFAHLLLADEINRATPKTQSALLEAMQEATVTVGKVSYDLPQPFMVLATQNPIENEGTYPLPEAQLDRFMFKLHVKYPSLEELKAIMDLTVTNQTTKIHPVVDGQGILNMRKIIKDVPMADAVKDYALKVILSTHPEYEGAPEVTKQYVAVGASPRGAQAIYTAAKVRALMEGRLNVSFDDVRFVAYPALRHRLLLNFEGISDGKTADEIIGTLLDYVKVV